MFSCDVTKVRSFARYFVHWELLFICTLTFPIGSMEKVKRSC